MVAPCVLLAPWKRLLSRWKEGANNGHDVCAVREPLAPPFRKKLLFKTLEPRILLSAALAPTLDPVEQEPAADILVATTAASDPILLPDQPVATPVANSGNQLDAV